MRNKKQIRKIVRRALREQAFSSYSSTHESLRLVAKHLEAAKGVLEDLASQQAGGPEELLFEEIADMIDRTIELVDTI